MITIIKKWLPERGFGFAESRDTDGILNGRDIFVHANVLPNGFMELRPGQNIEIDITAHPKGPRATSLRLL